MIRTTEYTEPLTVTDVRQYFYCARIVFYRLNQPLRRPTTYKMQEGKLAQERTAALEHRRSLAAYGIPSGERRFDVRLYSSQLGLQGILDMLVITDDEAVVVEFKNTTQPPARNHTYQLTAYAMLVEEQLGLHVRRAFVYQIPLQKANEITITAAMRRSVGTSIDAMRQMVAREEQPEPTTHRERCAECEYRRFCADIA